MGNWVVNPFQKGNHQGQINGSSTTWHGPDFTCNFPQTVLRPIETDQSQIRFSGGNLLNLSTVYGGHPVDMILSVSWDLRSWKFDFDAKGLM